MSHAGVMCKRSLLLAGLVLASALAMVGVAHAESFGEIRRFGGPGKKAGELTPAVLEKGDLAVEWSPEHVIGVDPKTNDVFVLEETEEQEEKSGKKSKTTQFFRLQELNPEKEELLGSDEFEFTAAGEVEHHAIEGIAVDPNSERLYFLLTEERPEGKEPNELLDESTTAATALYAFKTTPNAKKLEPVAEAVPLKETEYESTASVLIGPSALKPSSQTAGEALLEPHGITVDPSTGEVIITAHIDETPCEDEEEVNCEPDALNNPEDHYAIERVKENGASEQRYVDTGNVLKSSSEEYYLAPSSPVVAADSGSERLLTLHPLEPEFSTYVRGLAEFPAGVTGTPTQLPLTHSGGLESGLEEVEEEPGGAIGGSLAVDSEESSTLFGVTRIKNEEVSGKPELLYAITERSAETLKPIGWSGGQRTSATDTCDLQPQEDGEHIQIAAGSHGDIFVLVPEYLREPLRGAPKFPTNKAIIEFGPGGKGCPAASVEKIAASVGGKETSSAATGQKVTLSSFVKQGDALSTVWKLENEANKKVLTTEQREDDQYQTPTLETTFTEGAEYKITEEIETDNLATPSLNLSRTFKVTANTKPLTITTEPANQTVEAGQKANFTAGATGSPTPSPKWLISTDGGKEFAPDTRDEGEFSNTLTVTATGADDGYEYRAEYSNGTEQAETRAATLTVTPAKITTTTTTTTTTEPPPPTITTPKQNVEPFLAVAPKASLASASLVVSSSGAASIKVSCPAGATTCSGTVTLKTLTAVKASKGKEKGILTLVTGSFSVAGGQTKTITVHLSKTARALLAKDHKLRARATVASHDPASEKATTIEIVTLRPAPVKHKH